MSVYIEGIALYNFSDSKQPSSFLELGNFARHALFHSFLSYGSKQYSATTSNHSKHIIELLQKRKIIFADISNIWKNKYGCDD